METPLSRRQQYIRRLKGLKSERSKGWDSIYRELGQYISPRSTRFFTRDVNSGEKREQSIINATATDAADTQASGMMAGITSPARPWGRMTTFDQDLAEFGRVKEWLSVVTHRILWLFGITNLYNVLYACYLDLPVFGTAALVLDEDAKTVMRAYPQPIGEYYLATNDRLEVDTLYREYRMTVRQMVRKFGLKACSERVQRLYRDGKLDEWIDVARVIEPREARDARRYDGPNKPISSCWFEMNGDAKTGLLRESGYDESPLIAPRWNVLGEDVYGTSPGMAALGDVKQLQLLERKKSQGVERIVDPPLAGPASLQNQVVAMFPGGITYLDTPAGGQRLEPVVQVPPAVINVSNDSIERAERRINRTFKSDLWLMMAQGESDPQRTAREVVEMHEEKMLQLGPIYTRLEAELLNPIWARAFGILSRAGFFPPPPPELQGQELRVEFSSIMAQAQKMVEGGAVRELAGFGLEIAAVDATVLDKINLDEVVASYADALGVNPKLIRPDDEVQQIRQQRAQAQAQQAQAEQAAAMAKGARDLSQTNLSGDNALSRLVGGVAAAQADGAS